MNRLLPILALFFAGCLVYDRTTRSGQHDHLFVMGNVQHLQVGDSGLTVDGLDTVAVWDAAGRMIGSIGVAAADAMIAHGVARAVSNGATNGVQLLAATIPSGIHKAVTRKTNRTTPVPVKP